eukprot:117608-Rhodomonas_salina.1
MAYGPTSTIPYLNTPQKNNTEMGRGARIWELPYSPGPGTIAAYGHAQYFSTDLVYGATAKSYACSAGRGTDVAYGAPRTVRCGG